MTYQYTVHDYQGDVEEVFPSDHAELRMAHRNVSLEDVYFILHHGHRFHKAGALMVHLRGKDIPPEYRAAKRFSRLEGTTIVLSLKDLRIITIWRNRQSGMARIRRKLDRTSRPDRVYA